jgi:hypothetical protein
VEPRPVISPPSLAVSVLPVAMPPQYLNKGSFYAAGPIGLLAALTPMPSILTTHFFLVALFAVRLTLAPFPSPARLIKSYKWVLAFRSSLLPSHVNFPHKSSAAFSLL